MKQQRTSNGDDKASNLKPDQKIQLFRSLGLFLEQNGFSKTLKKFLKEAKIEKDDLKDASVNLEETYCKYLEACNFAVKNFSNQKELDSQTKNVSKSDEDGTETLGKKNKKRSGKSDTKNIKEVAADTAPNSNGKTKEKKKGKRTSDSCVETESLPGLDSGTSKDVDDKRDVEASSKKKSKELKKRKTEASEENDAKLVDGTTIEESKRKRTEDLEKSEGGEQSENSRENGQIGQEMSNKTPKKDTAGQENGIDGGQKSGSQKSGKIQCETSTELKTANAFCRVKIDEVKFADERLQDNSYWAKDGAESGYGAKAQEVLGQVRGRGFRHEKTKKKRGTYRGGQIDLQSYSIKFNYSDEED